MSASVTSVPEFDPIASFKPNPVHEHPTETEQAHDKKHSNTFSLIPAINVVIIAPNTQPSEPAKTVSSLNSIVPPENPVNRECAICFETSKTKQLCESSSCSSLFCEGCIKMYLEIKIQDGQVRRIRCPGIDCTTILNSHHIHGAISDEYFTRYLTLKEKLRSGRVCPPCGQPVTSTGRKISCNSCSATTCGDCGEPYHLFSCKDTSYKAWCHQSEHDVRPCPNCHAHIEKHGGCDHMACTHCEFEFCWLCRVAWEDHVEPLCKPRAFLESESSSLGPNAPIRAVTKSVVVVAATSVAAIGVGFAAALAPPVLIYNGVKNLLRRQKQAKAIKKLEALRQRQAQVA